MLKILFCTDYLIAGGIEAQLVELVTRLDRHHFEPHVAYLYGERAGRSLHYVARLQDAGVSVYAFDLGWSPADKAHGLVHIVRLVRRLRPNIVQAENYHSNLLTRLARPLLPRRSVLVGTFRTAAPTRKQSLYEVLSWRQCATIVCTSVHLQSALVTAGRVPRNQTEMIPAGVDVDQFEQYQNGAQRERLRAGAHRVALLMARIAPEKAPDLAVKAISLLKSANRLPEGTQLWLVGESTHPLTQARISETVHRHDLGHMVLQFPKTDQPQAYFTAADVTVLPSLFEGFGMVTVESLASGTPVIISEAANRAGIIEHGKTGWIVPTNDVEALADCLAMVLALPATELQGMREACVERAKHYDVHAMVERYQGLYNRYARAQSPGDGWHSSALSGGTAQ